MGKPSVLVVDDEKNAVTLVSAILGDDFEVEAFVHAGEALSRAKTKSFDVVVTDFVMPGMNGMELLKELDKSNPFAEQVLVTGAAELFLKQHSDTGRVVYLFKPYKPETLVEIVQRLAKVAQSRKKGA